MSVACIVTGLRRQTPGSGLGGRTRSGAILLLVAGLAALLLSLAAAFLIRLRSQAENADLAIREAQARLMLSAAVAYLQETQRLGWGGSPESHAYGWTDVRDGEPGPRGRVAESGQRPLLGWSPGGTFPAPGGAMRGDAFAWRLPPYAVRQDAVPKPLRLDPVDLSQDAITARLGTPWLSLAGNRDDHLSARANDLRAVWDRAVAHSGGRDALTIQPAADTWPQFVAGSTAHTDLEQRVSLESVSRGWFRIYRERDQDHDGSGSPWYDTIAMPGHHGVFIVTVGAGGTRGFRFWDRTGRDWLNGDGARSGGWAAELEPQTAEESGMFPDQSTFAALRARERILWFRVAIGAEQSLGYDAMALAQYQRKISWNQAIIEQNRYSGIFTHNQMDSDHGLPPFAGGHVQLLQRLDQEPPRW